VLSVKQAIAMAENLEGARIEDHFGVGAFFVNKRIFATVWYEKKIVNLRLGQPAQKHFLSEAREGFVKVGSGLGKIGFTRIQLQLVKRAEFREALRRAWEHSSKRSTSKVRTS
jgi:hypothetical protein